MHVDGRVMLSAVFGASADDDDDGSGIEGSEHVNEEEALQVFPWVSASSRFF